MSLNSEGKPLVQEFAEKLEL